jgi:hypothetical protein
VNDTDLFVLLPWLVFALAVFAIVVVAFNKDRRVTRMMRRFRRRLRRH